MKKLILLFIFVSITCLVFCSSCVNKEVETTDYYYETEYISEPYVEIGQQHVENLLRQWSRNPPLYFSIFEWSKAGAYSFIDGYKTSTAELSKSQARLVLSSAPQSTLWGIIALDFTGAGPIGEFPAQDTLASEKLVKGEMKYIPTPGEQKWLDDLGAIASDPERVLCVAESEEQTDLDIVFDVTGVEQFAVIQCVPWMGGRRVIDKVQLIWTDEETKYKMVPNEVMKQRTITTTEKAPFWEILFSK